MAEALLDGEAESLIRKFFEKAIAGDVSALRFCVGRILPPRRDRPVAFDLPEIKTAADAQAAASVILANCAEGNMSMDEAGKAIDLIEKYLRVTGVTDFDARLRAMEKGASK
jgi:hypothetical protein